MKLEGSLDAFSLPDIFQLLSYTKKTGGLRLQHADEHGVVYFADGAVTGASAEGGRQALARRLIGLGLVDSAAVSAAVASALELGATENGGGVVAALVAAGALAPEQVAPVASEHLHDAVFELMRWPSGDFAFAVDDLNPDDVGVRLPSEDVVTHASEQRIRWGAAAALVPSPESVPVIAGVTGDTAVSSADWTVLRLVDGHRRVTDIVDLLGGVLLSTVVALADLVERGLVEMRSADAVDPVTELARRLDLLAPAESATVSDARSATTEPSVVAVAPAAVPEPSEDEVAKGDHTPALSTGERPPEVAQDEATPEFSNVDEAPDVPDAAAAPDAPDAAAAATERGVPAPEPIVAAVIAQLTAVPAPLRPATPAASTVVTVEDTASGPATPQPRLGGAHTPGDVVPPRVEPFLAPRQPDFAEASTSTRRTMPPRAVTGTTDGSSAVAMAPAGDTLIERDPSVNRSLLLRLIAGVRGL